MFFLKIITLLTFTATAALQPAAGAGAKATPFMRPAVVQEAINQTFKQLVADPSGWMFDGKPGFTSLVALQEEEIIRELAERLDTTDIFLMDIGAGKGGWGRTVLAFIKKYFSDCNKRFHIISLTGDKLFDGEKDTTITVDANVTLYELTCFKIENTSTELKKRLPDLNLTSKVDFITSNWTLRHLVDPMGTLTDWYDNLLKPETGIIVTNGFFFTLEGIEDHAKNVCNTEDWYHLFTHSSARCLFKVHAMKDNISPFVLVKPTAAPLNLPLIYANKEPQALTGDWQCYSERITKFNVTHPALLAKTDLGCYHKLSETNPIVRHGDLVMWRIAEGINKSEFYGNEDSYKLHQELATRGLFYSREKAIRWKTSKTTTE